MCLSQPSSWSNRLGWPHIMKVLQGFQDTRRNSRRDVSDLTVMFTDNDMKQPKAFMASWNRMVPFTLSGTTNLTKLSCPTWYLFGLSTGSVVTIFTAELARIIPYTCNVAAAVRNEGKTPDGRGIAKWCIAAQAKSWTPAFTALGFRYQLSFCFQRLRNESARVR